MSERVFVGGGIDGRRGLGWLPDYPDLRDYTHESEEIEPLLAKTAVKKPKRKKATRKK